MTFEEIITADSYIPVPRTPSPIPPPVAERAIPNGDNRIREALHPPPARPRHAPARVEPTNVLGVFGLSVRTRERDLEDEFARYGEVEKVVIVYDQRTDRSRGFGFITMRTVEDAQLCVEKLNGLLLHGRAVRVDFSATQRPHAPTPGEYLGVKRPIYEERGGYGRGGYDDRRGAPYGGGGGRFEDRRDYGGRGGYDDRDRMRDRPYRSRDDDPYGGRSRRDERDDLPPRKRSISPDAGRRRYDDDDRRAPLPVRDYDAPAATEASRY